MASCTRSGMAFVWLVLLLDILRVMMEGRVRVDMRSRLLVINGDYRRGRAWLQRVDATWAMKMNAAR